MKFFKILLPGFKTQLNLPTHFCTMSRSDITEEALITTCLGSWSIRVGRRSERFYFHGNEWASFVRKHELNFGDLIMFDHHGSFHFHASIFDPSACEKEFEPNPEPSTNTDGTANPTFTRVLSAHAGRDHRPSLCRLYLPTKIWKPNNLHQKKEAILQISGSNRRVWPGKLICYPASADGGYSRLAVSHGWFEFVSDNNIREGHMCKFEIIIDPPAAFGYSPDAVIIIVTK